VNVLRDTHRALVPGAALLDFHPVVPPVPRIEAGPTIVGLLDEPGFPDQLRAAEAGMDEAVRLGLFRLVTEQTQELNEHYDDADELIDAWEIDGDLERAVLAATGPLRVVEKVAFRLYRTLESGTTSSPTRMRPGVTTSP
jgi:hypothetical protein